MVSMEMITLIVSNAMKSAEHVSQILLIVKVVTQKEISQDFSTILVIILVPQAPTSSAPIQIFVFLVHLIAYLAQTTQLVQHATQQKLGIQRTEQSNHSCLEEYAFLHVEQVTLLLMDSVKHVLTHVQRVYSLKINAHHAKTTYSCLGQHA